MVRVMRQPGREISYWSKNGPTRSVSKSAAVIGVFWSWVAELATLLAVTPGYRRHATPARVFR